MRPISNLNGTYLIPLLRRGVGVGQVTKKIRERIYEAEYLGYVWEMEEEAINRLALVRLP